MATEQADSALTENEEVRQLKQGYKYGWHDEVASYNFVPQRGVNHEILDTISDMKNEPDWMRKFRHKALEYFWRRPMPKWGADLSGIDFDNIYYYVKPIDEQAKSWEDMPAEMRETWDKLGIPEAEKNYLGGVSVQYESESVYHSTKKELDDLGVIFTDMDTAVREHPDLVKEYWATVIPPNDNKFAALNSAVWSGGSFIWVPKGVSVDIPLQAYFRINQENMGQFERTLIICEDESWVHYVEGCSAPVYSSDSLHSAVVEIIVKDGARCRYTTIQNWSSNVYNLVTKRAVAYKNAVMEWTDGNIGSRVTMKYPAVILKGEGSKAEILSVAYAGEGQHQDAGAKVTHVAPNTQSTIISKSISKDGGRAGYRGLVRIDDGAKHAKSNVRCDALILDENSRSDTYPYNEVDEETASVGHEATVSRVGDEQLFYLMSRGIGEAEAMSLIVRGFIEPVVKTLPLEYSVELNRLIELEMEGSVG